MEKRSFLAGAARLAAATVIGMFLLTSCNKDLNTDEGVKVNRVASPKEVTPTDTERYATYDMKMSCAPSESSFEHNGIFTINVFVKGADAPETTMVKELKSKCSISCAPDTIRVSEDWSAIQANVSIARSYKANVENDNIAITVSDGRVLTLPYEAQHASEKYMNVTYVHGHDSLLNAKLVAVKQYPIETKATAEAGKYIKSAYSTKYLVEITTQPYSNGEKVGVVDKDTLATTAITLVLDENNASYTEGNSGEEVINEHQQKDSVTIITTWDDGHQEINSHPTVLERYLKNIEKRELFANSFDGQNADASFSIKYGDEKFVRKDEKWTVYGREFIAVKKMAVNGHSEEIRYTFYQERADFHFKGVSHSFKYVNWTVENYADDFKPAMLSSKAGYDELDYTNEIKTSYLGYIQMSSEAIAWFKEQVHAIGWHAENAERHDNITLGYTSVTLEKIAEMSDGSFVNLGKFSAKMPIEVTPLTNWLVNDDVFGVYTSGALTGNLSSKSAETAEKFFSYNKYAYTYGNDVNGQANKLQVVIANDIVFNDGELEYHFTDSDLSVEKKNEGTSFVGEDESKTTYAYTCLAGVTFGESSQDCTLPGTINIAKAAPQPEPENHAHGKVVATYCTSTPNENRSFWYNVAVIAFEDGYKMVGMADNNAMEFNFNMSSTATNINSAVCVNGAYVPAFAKDDSSSMKWYDEAGNKRVVLDYISATASAWNNGHNTVWDVRREGRISEDGYSVTFYLNGLAGTTMRF